MSLENFTGFIIDTYNAASDALANVSADFGQRLADIAGGYNINDNTLSQSQYDFRYRVFPEEIGNDNVGHYMVININVPVTASGGGGTARTSYTGGQRLLQEYSKVDSLRFGGAVNIPSSPNAQNAVLRDPISIPRYTRRIAESIAIFMPTPMIYTTKNDYQEISLTALATGLAVGAGSFIGGAIGGETGARIGGGLASAFTGQTAGQVSGLLGYPINPRVEVIFSRTHLRQFTFEFLMAPRNEKESISLRAIVNTLRYHSVPELDSVTEGFTYVPPAEFDFTFYNKNMGENLYVPRINTCVLDRVEVDYAPTGVYSTFSTGHPVMVRLSLGLSEVEPLHKRRILQGF